MLRSSLTLISCFAFMSLCAADEKPATKVSDANRLAYLDECNPWYPHKDFPKLITPQWVGEEGVEAVIVLAIDDMRDPAKYEQYLRPILNRLKQIDGRAPVSIMTCDVKADDAQLQSWLGEGLSIECHTIDHPCPILQGGDGLKKVSGTLEASPVPKEGETPESSRHLFEPALAKAKSTYDRCVDLMGTIPGNKPVAFRTPCCDSLNTVSPRFFSEIFSKTTEKGNFLQIDSSVFTFFTSEDESLPKELVLDANGKERFWKYLPKNNKYGGNTHDNFVNYIKNYPYPYVINNSCWEIPCIAPSDWSAQHLHGINNPVTIEDWKAAIDLTVHKQGCFSLVFHPHGWIKPEQVVEMIDHAVTKHGNKVKFLNFKEVAERLNHVISHDSPFRKTTKRSSHDSQNTTSTYRDLPEATIQALAASEATKTWPIFRTDDTYNGFFIHDNHFCWINEDTAKLPDLMYRVSFDEVLAAAKNEDSKSQISNLKSEIKTATYNPVSIGAAVVDITPDYPVRLTGYGNRMKESDGVAAKIHARALVIGGPKVAVSLRRDEPLTAPQSSGPPVASANDSAPDNAASADHANSARLISAERDGYTVLITVDNCGVPLEMTEAVYERIAAKFNIPRENFAISSTHSHSAPWLRGFAPNIFTEIPDDHAAHLAQYEKVLTDKLVDVVEKAIASQRPGHLSYGFGEAGFAMNRRALANGKWSGFGEVPDGPTDKRVPVLAAHDVDGKLIAVLANYACHCTTETGEFNQISGDWAGFAADMLEADHPGAVALIAIGCGADANPSPRGTHEQAKGHGRTIADEVNRLLANVAVSLRRDEPLPAPQDSGTPVASAKDSATDNAASANNANTARLISTERDGYMKRINPDILCNMARIDLPLGPIPSRETWEQQAKEPGVTGSRARYFLQMLDEGKTIPTTIPNYPVQTWCFGNDLAMVFLGGEVVVDYSIRMNDMFDSDRLWINAYSNDVPCYIASARVLREGGYECDSSMLYYRRPTRLAPEAEDVLCDAVQKIMPHKFYSEKLQQDFPAPKSPEQSLKTMTTKPDLRVVLAASEPLIRDPVAFDWDERGRLWVVEMGDYPKGDSKVAVSLRRDEPLSAPQDTGSPVATANTSTTDNAASADQANTARLTSAERDGYRGRVQMLEDTDKNGVYDKATTFLDNLAFPTGIHCWRGGVIVTMAPEIFYAEDTDGDGKADVRKTLYKGFVEGNQQHRINGLRWGLDGWLYLANGDSGGEIEAVGTVVGDGTPWQSYPAPGELPVPQRLNIRGRDLRIEPDTGMLDTVSGQTQFGRERDDFGNWFGNNNSNPIWQYVLEDRYVRRNPHAGISQVTAPVAVVPGAAPVYPTSRTLARFNDFAFANRFTSACSTMIYRDNYLGEQYYGNAFTSEPVHNLVSRLVMTRDGYGFKGERAADEQQSEFLASSDNWFRPTMIRTGPDGAIWVADMYRAVIEHPEWIPPEYQRKMNLYAGSDMGRIYRIVPASECCGEKVAVSLRRVEPLTAPRDVEKPTTESGTREVAAAGDSTAEQRQSTAPIVSLGIEISNDDQAPERRQNIAQEHGESALVDEAKTARLISAERDGYFDSAAEQRQPIAPGVSPGIEITNDDQASGGRQNVAQEHGEPALADDAKTARLNSAERDGDFDSAAEQRQPIAPGVSPGIEITNDDQAPKGRQNIAKEHGESALADDAKTAKLISAERDGYFEQPWNDIPLVQLRQRIQSSNGWWRDTAHRILMHRIHELDSRDITALVQAATGHANEAVSVQAGSLLSSICEHPVSAQAIAARAEAIPSLLTDVQPSSRRMGLQMVESSESERPANDLVMSTLEGMTSDEDRSVRLQLALTSGRIKHQKTSIIIAKLLLRDFDDTVIRNAAISSLTPFSIENVLTTTLNLLPENPNEQIVGLLLGQAAAMEEKVAITGPLMALISSLEPDATAERIDSLASTVSNVLNGDIVKRLQSNRRSVDVINAASAVAQQIALDETADVDRRAAAIRFAGVSAIITGSKSLDLIQFLTPQTPFALQLSAVQLMGRDFNQQTVDQIVGKWSSLDPTVRAEAMANMLKRENSIGYLLDQIEAGSLSSGDLDASQRDRLVNHSSGTISERACKVLGEEKRSVRSAVVDDFKSQISNLKFEISKDEQATAGKLVFEKRCAACHRLQDIGKEVGADLAALKDRSTDALLTAILDPNKAVESKFLVYTVVTKDGLQHSGMLKGETGGSLTLIGNDGKEITVVRANIEELVGSQRSLMPEGLEKDLTAVDLANVIAFVQSTGTPWKRFDGNAPKFVAANEDGSVTLPASSAEIYGPSLIFEEKYGNLGYWLSADDYARWTFEVPKSGHWTVEFDFACDDSNAGSLIKFSTGNRMLTARVPGSGTWDNYQTWQAGTIDLHRGRGQLIITAPEKPPFALIDLRAVRLIPPK